MKSLDMPKLSKKAGLIWNKLKMEPQLPDGRSLWKNGCKHLESQIGETFGVKISESDWQHWNGGAFLFSDDSAEFLETWHQNTLQIFENPNWKTRDQGTLIATVWKYGLQNQPVLHPKWNCIADYHNPEIATSGNSITLDGQNFFEPQFIHIYHHFGDASWEIWNWAVAHEHD